MTGEHLKYLCNLFNSKPVAWFFKSFYAGGGLGENGVRMKHTFFENFCCVPKNSTIEELVNEVLNGNKNSEIQIDRKVYELYGLNKEEIEFVEKK